MSANPWDEHADAFAAWTADRYGAAPEGTSPLVAALLDALGDVAGREVLDAACGEGLLGRVLARRGARDRHRRLGPAGRDRPARDPSGAIGYRVADLCRPIPDLAGGFDLIGSHLALNDVADHRGFAATRAQLLRPGGRLALALNNPYSSVVRGHVADYFDSGALGVYGGMSAALGGTVRYHHRTLGEYLDAFLGAGLRLATLVDVRQENQPFPFFMVLASDRPGEPRS